MTDPLERRQASPLAKSFTFFGVLVLLTVISLIGMGVMLIRLNALVDDNHTNSEHLIECTTPGPKPPPDTGHKCFDDAQTRLGLAVRRIVDANGNGTSDIQDLADALGVKIP